MKPEKKWVVGTETFDDYREAQKYATKHKVQLLRDELIFILGRAIRLAPYGEAKEESAPEIADEILARFEIKVRETEKLRN